MGFFSHAAMLGVGYWIGKSYCFRYKIQELHNDPNSSEYVLRVERKEGPFWGNPWWHHHHQHCQWMRNNQQQPQQGGEPAQKTSVAKNPELLEVEAK